MRLRKGGGSKKGQPKKIKSELIPMSDDDGSLSEPRRLLNDLIAGTVEHSKLVDITFCMVWRDDVKPDRDGRVQPGWIKILDVVRRLKGEEAEITINRDWWNHPNTTLHQKLYCLDDLLSQITIQTDPETDVELQDEKGRYLLRKVKHDVVVFSAVEDRYPSGTNLAMKKLLTVLSMKQRVEGGDRFGLADVEDEEVEVAVTA